MNKNLYKVGFRDTGNSHFSFYVVAESFCNLGKKIELVKEKENLIFERVDHVGEVWDAENEVLEIYRLV